MSAIEDFDQYVSSPTSNDYDQIIGYIKANGADFKTQSNEEALSYVRKLESAGFEGGLYAVELAGEYHIIIP